MGVAKPDHTSPANQCASCTHFGTDRFERCARGTHKFSFTCNDREEIEMVYETIRDNRSVPTVEGNEKPMTPYEKLRQDPDARLEHISKRLDEFKRALNTSNRQMLDEFQSGYYVHHTDVRWMVDELTKMRKVDTVRAARFKSVFAALSDE